MDDQAAPAPAAAAAAAAPAAAAASSSSHAERVKRVRNICIVAHVDAGKTTLCDQLVATNGFVSQRQAGKVQFMDSMEEEQRRGITLKSSAITLLHREHYINLIDSPGHVDFSSEVGTAVRLSDGAVVVVDMVEGFCAQTQTVLRQAHNERLKCILMLNKFDRLITELKLTPLEALRQTRAVIDTVNSFVSTLDTELLTSAADGGADDAVVDADTQIAFSPTLGNVVFGSAYQGWGFALSDFARRYAEKLGMNEAALNATLWGDFYFHAKSKRVLRNDMDGVLKPMFAQFILEPIWQLYGALTEPGAELSAAQSMIAKLGIAVSERELKQADRRAAAQAVFSRWLPLAPVVFEAIIAHVPSPDVAQPLRMPFVWPLMYAPGAEAAIRSAAEAVSQAELAPEALRGASPDAAAREFAELRDGALHCRPDAQGVSAIVSKVVAVDSSILDAAERVLLSRLQDASMLDTDAQAGAGVNRNFIGFARVLSGTLRLGQQLFALGPRYNPQRPWQYRQALTVERLYIMMGKGLDPVQQVGAGLLCAIGGIRDAVLKTATLVSTSWSYPLTSGVARSAAILRVAVDPERPTDVQRLARGLRLLQYADPAAEIELSSSGEHILACCGEVHLEHCLKELRERYAGVPLVVSDPIVPFRETVVGDARAAPLVERRSPDTQFHFACQTRALPASLALVLEQGAQRELADAAAAAAAVAAAAGNRAKLLRACLSAVERDTTLSAADRAEWLALLPQVIALGPASVGTCLLVVPPELVASASASSVWASGSELGAQPDATSGAMSSAGADSGGAGAYVSAAASSGFDVNDEAAAPAAVGSGDVVPAAASAVAEHAAASGASASASASAGAPLASAALLRSVVAGFQMAAQAGPLCAEPMHGVCVVVTSAAVLADAEVRPGCGPLTGQIVSTVKEAVREAARQSSPRLVEAMFELKIEVPSEAVGKVYHVLNKRRAVITHEDLKQGTNFFVIDAVLPVTESIGFAADIRKKTSGAVSNPQLLFSHWQTLEQDPFWVPTTLEELELHGEKGDSPIYAHELMNKVRKRKGLEVDEQLVAVAEQQRTLSKKK